MQKLSLVSALSALAVAFVASCSSESDPGGLSTGGAGSGGSGKIPSAGTGSGATSGKAGASGAAAGTAAGGSSGRGATAGSSGARPPAGGSSGRNGGTGGSAAGGVAGGGSGGRTSGGETGVTGTPSSGGMAGTGGGTPGNQWVGTWATAVQATEPNNLPTPLASTDPIPADPGLKGNTLRQFIRVSIGGTQIRLRLSNEYGTKPVTMDSVHVAKSKGPGAIDVATDKALAFGGGASVTIPAGQAATSDALDFALAPLSDIAISIKFGDQSYGVTGHPGSRTTSYIQTGDAVSEASLAGATLKPVHWYFISELDVTTDDKGAALVVLGDSLTDGRGTTNDGNDRWTDVLARRFQADPATRHIGVLNMGIGGNQVLRNGLGTPAKARFDHDVLGPAGVKWLVVLEGVNDIGSNTTTDVSADLIAAYREFVSKAKNANIKAFGSPILPFKGNGNYDTNNPIGLTQRKKVNEWIRAAGNFDAVIDLDAAVRDPADPDKLLATYADLAGTPAGSTDWLHLNPSGYKAMADAVDLNLFK